MQFFLGVDIAGASNTWICGLTSVKDELRITHPPVKSTLSNIVQLAEKDEVVAVAIDAQLTGAISEENGFRSSDMQLREMLPPNFRNWVASQNSLMAVPIRGRQLAEALAPRVGTIIETHPRACLLFCFPDLAEHIHKYKSPEGHYHQTKLWKCWCEHFRIRVELDSVGDGAIDSLVCATVACLYHLNPERLMKLTHSAPDRVGRGPFYVLKPIGK